MDIRLNQIKDWLNVVLDEALISLLPASEDASFRRYLRATTDSGTYVVMDAPPSKESMTDFIAVDEALIAIGVHAPEIIHKNVDSGFLLLEDLGERVYLDELPGSPENLYSEAIKALVKIQGGEKNCITAKLPPLKNYDAARLDMEMSLFKDWYLKRHLDINLDSKMQLIWQDTKSCLIQNCLQQPQTWVHRDYHSRNLMVAEENSPAVIDFQDMVIGPIGYDLASLFKDCYIEWPRKRQHQWLEEYIEILRLQQTEVPFVLDDLIRWVDFCGLQRHLKVLGIFCRLNYRDGKSQYMNDLPMVQRYVLEVIEIYPEFLNLRAMLKSIFNQVSAR